MRSLATLRSRVRNDAPVPLTSSRGGGGAIGGGTGASTTDLLGKMGAVPTLFSVVNRTSTATAALDWHLYRVPSDGRRDPGEDREEITTKHAAVDLWRDPNPFMSTADLVETCQQHMDLVGETIMVVTKMGKIPVELWPVRPDRMTPVTDPTKFLVGWIYKDPDGGKIPLNAEDVIQIKMPNPSDPYRGLGPVQALLADLDSMRYSSEWSRNFFLNSAEPGGVIELPTHLSDTQWDEFTTRWQEQHRGVNRAHRVAVVEYGGKYVPRGFSMRDLMFPELRTMGRDTVYEAFGVSLATMGVTEGVNYAAAKAARTQFAELLTVPRANRWRGGLNRQLLPMFEPSAAKRKPGQPVVRTVEFDYDSPVQGDDESENAERLAKANAASIYITAGFDPVSVAEALGLPDMQYGTEEDDPDRNLMLSLIKAAPAALAPTLLPILLPDVEGLADALKPPPPPGFGGAEPPLGEDGKPVPPEDAPPGTDKGAAPHPDGAAPGKPFPGAKDHAHAAVRLASAAELEELGAAWDVALDRVMAAWPDIAAGQRDEVRAQIVAAVDADDLAALASLTVGSAAAAALLVGELTALAATAAGQVVAANPDVALAPVTPEGLAAVAATVAALLAAELALAAGREALRVAGRGEAGSQVASEVDEALRQRSDASVRAQVGGALTGAANRARVDTMASGPVGSVYADETLDGNTCAACRTIHGRFVCTTDDLAPYDRLYTSMGGYVGCLGGVRCRGTVTGVWRPATTTEPLIPAGREAPFSGAGELPTAGRHSAPDWDEEAHPRDPDGKFGTGIGSRTSLDHWSDAEAGAIADIAMGGPADGRLVAIQHAQGFDGLPQVLDAEQFDALGEDHQRIYRGIAGGDAQGWADELRDGEFFAGLGTYGNGTYTTTDQGNAAGYARGHGWRGADVDGLVVEMALRPDARTIGLQDLRVAAAADERLEGGDYAKAFGDPGRLAAALGYDAIRMKPDKAEAEEFLIVLNRRALAVKR